MAKFHITSKGEAAQCRASKKACPLGGEHFDSAEEAMLSTYAAELGNATAGRRELAPASAESRADADREQLRKQEQLKLILEKNPMQDDYHVGIRKLEDIKTLEDAYRHDVQEELNNAWTDQPDEIYEEAFRTGVITVYSSKTFQEGDFVSTSYNEAEQYAGPGGVNSKEVPLEHVAWIDSSEGMYAPVEVSEEPEQPTVVERVMRSHEQRLDLEIQVQDERDPAKLAEHARSSSGAIREVAARNRSTPQDTLRTLASDPSATVRAAVAANEMTPAPVLEALAKEGGFWTNFSLSGNPATPPSVAARLQAANPEGFARARALRKPSRPRSDSPDPTI